MFDAFLESLSSYYGLDWMTMIFGMTGTWLVTNQNRMGFVLSALAALCGFSVAAMAGQFGFLVSNALTMALMLRGFTLWGNRSLRSRSMLRRQNLHRSIAELCLSRRGCKRARVSVAAE
jgi:hypothetical protein